jgi:predicted MPP superfamily phosphohydrolase
MPLIPAAFIIVIGACALVADLGCRLFGSYRRTIPGMVVRIGAILVAFVLLVAPVSADAVAARSDASLLTLVSCVVGVAVAVHFLFPLRLGVRRFRAPCAATFIELTRDIRLDRETVGVVVPRAAWQVLRCLVLADLHCDSQAQFARIAEALNGLRSETFDFVFVLGDLGENAELLPQLLRRIGGLSAGHGTFLVRGNHDSACLAEIAEEHSLKLLPNVVAEIPDLGVAVVGVEAPWNRGAVAKTPDAAFTIALSHTPDNIRLCRRMGVQLVLAGHTHGGGVRLPLVGPLAVPTKLGRFLDKGWFRCGDTLMHVTPGIGYRPGRFGRRGSILELTIRNLYDSGGPS